MTDERKPVMCPCGRNMGYMPFPYFKEDGKERGAYICICGWRAPVGRGATQEDAERAAYIAATATPPNLPMTREQVEALPNLAAVWVVNRQTAGCVIMSAISAREMYCGRSLWEHRMLFAAPPTPADIEAARKENNHD